MALTHEDVASILKIIDESPYDEVRLEIGDFKLHVSRHGPVSTGQAEPVTERSAPESRSEAQAAAQTEPTRGAQQSGPRAPAAEMPLAEGLVAVRAPMLGTFYRAPSPGEAPFVDIGQKVGADDTVCLVEVMKLFNSIKAGVAGTVVKIAVENGSMVEYGQLLMLIESDSHAAEIAAVQ
jgi:acetyl-CoA carboxylase biotin carboxyl carrier protein